MGKVERRAGAVRTWEDEEGACSGRRTSVCAAVCLAGVCQSLSALRSRGGIQSPPSVCGVGLGNSGPASLSTRIPPGSTLVHTVRP